MVPRRSLAAAVLAAALAAAPATAHAEQEWYGYQVAATDAGGWGLILGGVGFDAPLAVVGGVATLYLGGPIVHAAHDHNGRAGISFCARAGGTLLGAAFGTLVGIQKGKEKRDESPLSGLGDVFVGAIVGYVAGALVDIIVIAREEKDPAAAPRMLSFGGRF